MKEPTSPARGNRRLWRDLRTALRAHSARLIVGALPVLSAVLATFLATVLTSPVAHAEPSPAQWRAALNAACESPQPADGLLRALGGGLQLREHALDAPIGVVAHRHLLMLPDGMRIRLDVHRRDDALAQVIIETSQRVPQRVAGQHRPVLWVVADGSCRVRAARRLQYAEPPVEGEQGAVAVQVLMPDLQQVRSRQLFDAPVPPGEVSDGVAVAMVDSGVNYTLPYFKSRLLRDSRGELAGYDWWDMDPRPFDSHPSRSPFLPQRHGTRTASVVLEDSPVARIAPMRYPRPDMARMMALVDDVAARGIGIVNLSLGGPDRAKWQDFEQAARQHPDILFVVSAGNNGRDLDQQPLWPASLPLDNLITVGSSDAQGLPARGSNWGRDTVDLLVPAEDLIATDFTGFAVRVSGSSYAAARVSALAACLQAAHPLWRARQLKTAIFRLAKKPVHESMAYVGVGVLPEPTQIARGACAPEPQQVTSLGTLKLSAAAIYEPGDRPGDGPDDRVERAMDSAPLREEPVPFTHALAPLKLMWIKDAGWALEELTGALAGAAKIWRQCGVRFTEVSIELLQAPRRMHHFRTRTAMALMKATSARTPAVWFMRDTLEDPAFDAQAIGRSNVMPGSGMMNTVWMTSKLQHPDVALAHELYHLLANTGAHVPEKDNLMHAQTKPDGVRLWDWQCDRVRTVGGAFELVTPLSSDHESAAAPD